MDWPRFFTANCDRKGLSDFFIRESGEVAMMIGKHLEFVPDKITVPDFDVGRTYFSRGRP
jgi:hypothetical protein